MTTAPALPNTAAARFGSDVIAETLRDCDIPYVALNPGASFRGLHDSLVNYLGNRAPEILLCLHEEHAVAIAHGFAKVTGRPMAAAVHSNVGLMHATMAIFNAWCDRMPVMVLGATGPVDAAQRRPWIDWIHTSADQGALVRSYVKWDAQPASVAAAREAVLRGTVLARSAPQGPVYINFDTETQEGPAPDQPFDDAARFLEVPTSGSSRTALRDAADRLSQANRIVVLAGRVSRGKTGWHNRIALVEALGAEVITDTKVAAAFPTDHPAYSGDLRGRRGAEARAALAQADVVLALDWVDLKGALDIAKPAGAAQVIRVTLDPHIHNGWSMDHQAHPPADLVIGADPDIFVADLLDEMDLPRVSTYRAVDPALRDRSGTHIDVERIAVELQEALGDLSATLTHVTLSWDGTFWPFRDPLDFLGSDGGGGLGAGPGHAIGAALALRDMGSDRLPVAICGDGDFLMGVTALWTAVHHRIPLLMIVANNRSFYNDEVHQERVARMRGRDVANKGVGIQMTDPGIALADMARAQGCTAFGPVTDASALHRVLLDAIAVTQAGGVAVVEVETEPGYPPALVNALTPTTKD
ncbi:MAG: thiamine pyrophosphate-binding protein [Celeribacter sp.]|jgi:thiamine pyrophosphate-dependent acetolactate synthase large subunit-like protein